MWEKWVTMQSQEGNPIMWIKVAVISWILVPPLIYTNYNPFSGFCDKTPNRTTEGRKGLFGSQFREYSLSWWGSYESGSGLVYGRGSIQWRGFSCDISQATEMLSWTRSRYVHQGQPVEPTLGSWNIYLKSSTNVPDKSIIWENTFSDAWGLFH